MSKKKTKKSSSPSKTSIVPNNLSLDDNNLQLQKEGLSWQKWGTIISSSIAFLGFILSFIAFLISNNTAQKSLKNAEIANETSQQSLKVAQDANEKSLNATQDANEISRQSLKVAQEANEKSLKATQDANDISRNSLRVAQEANEMSRQSLAAYLDANETSRQSLKLAEISNKIQVLPIIKMQMESINDIFSIWKKTDDIDESLNTDDYNINHFEPEGLVLVNVGKPMLSQFSCEIIDVYSILGVISIRTQPSMIFKHEWFIYDTRSHSKPSIFKMSQDDRIANPAQEKITIVFRQDKPFIRENLNPQIHKIRPFSNHIDFPFKTKELENSFVHFYFSKEHLIKITYYDLLNNNYEKYFLKKETYSNSGKNITIEINKNEYLEQLSKYNKNKYPDINNEQGIIRHSNIDDFWEKVDFSLKIKNQATHKLFKWFWAPNNKSVLFKSYSQDETMTTEQIDRVKEIENYINSIQ